MKDPKGYTERRNKAAKPPGERASKKVQKVGKVESMTVISTKMHYFAPYSSPFISRSILFPSKERMREKEQFNVNCGECFIAAHLKFMQFAKSRRVTI